MRRALTFLSFFIFSSNLVADTWYQSTVREIYPWGDGRFAIIFDTPSVDCTHSSDYLYVSVNQNGVTEDGAEKMLSVVLAAVAMDKAVNVYFKDTNGYCYVNRLRVAF